jgi:hypothetical protein
LKLWTLLDRSALPDAAIINNMRYANRLISTGVIVAVAGGPFVTNSPVQQLEDD